MSDFWFRKLCVDFQRFRVFVFCHRAYSKTQNPRKKFLLLFYNVGFFLNKFINVSFSLVMYLVTFVISVISGVSSNSVELTWPDVVACSARIVSGWMVVAWGTESYSGLAGNTYFVYRALRASALGLGQTVRLGKRNTLCCKSRMEIYFYLVSWVFIFHLLFIIFYVLNFFRIAKWWWLPWVSAVDLVAECPRLPIAEAPATFGERWGKVGRMMTREWSVSLRVCGVWVGERCRVPGMGLF